VRVEVYVDSGDGEENLHLFDQLLQNLEAEFGQPLEWERLEGKRACRIVAYREGSIDGSSEDLQEFHEWAVSGLLKLKKFFEDRPGSGSQR